MPFSPTAIPLKLSEKLILYNILVIEESDIDQVFPESVVLSITPLLPQEKPNVEFTKVTEFRFSSVGDSIFVQFDFKIYAGLETYVFLPVSLTLGI